MRFLIFLLLASWAIFANAQITISEAEVPHARTNEIIMIVCIISKYLNMGNLPFSNIEKE